jgi:hypothetical protein
VTRGPVLWPPPWKLTSAWRRAASLPWLVAMLAVFVVMVAVVALVALFSKVTGYGATVNRSREEVARTIEDFVNSRGGPWDWDDFISVPIVDPRLESIRARCAHLDEEFPPSRPGEYCGEGGFDVMRQFIHQLRESDG